MVDMAAVQVSLLRTLGALFLLVLSCCKSFQQVEKRIADLGYTLPTVPTPKGNYVQYTRTGNLIYTAGHLPQPAGGDIITGKLGVDMTVEQGYEAAKYAGLSIIATVKAAAGNLDRVRVVKVLGFVACSDDFTAQPSVINGCSDLFGEIFGDKGCHARSAVGTNTLPLNIPVEIEAIFEVEEDEE
mmetsp:Transcript_14392/g.24075  ORF Transcript_14392/g.24075 Transcript_14392/m.24075 type:complete len:185 (-) Transcript_14392:95-649(-)